MSRRLAMADAIARATAFLVAPGDAPGPVASSLVPEAARVIVLGGADDAEPLAAALALGLRAADRAPAALVAVWGVRGAVTRGAATPGAARLAGTLTRRGLAAHAHGRLVWLPLAAEPGTAAGDVRRAAAVVEGPLVTALAAPRPPEFDGLLPEHDFAVVAADPATPLARAAVRALADRQIPALACRPPRRGLPRALALAGMAAPRINRTLARCPLLTDPHYAGEDAPGADSIDRARGDKGDAPGTDSIDEPLDADGHVPGVDSVDVRLEAGGSVGGTSVRPAGRATPNRGSG